MERHNTTKPSDHFTTSLATIGWLVTHLLTHHKKEVIKEGTKHQGSDDGGLEDFSDQFHRHYYTDWWRLVKRFFKLTKKILTQGYMTMECHGRFGHPRQSCNF
jgi:hypothetical protein